MGRKPKAKKKTRRSWTRPERQVNKSEAETSSCLCGSSSSSLVALHRFYVDERCMLLSEDESCDELDYDANSDTLKKPRCRRSSIAPSDVQDMGNVSIYENHRTEQQKKVDLEVLKSHFEVADHLFDAKKITAENAFELRYLECMKDFIRSEAFDPRDMKMAGRLLEMGTKIYACRVEGVHKAVAEIANNLSAKTQRSDVAEDAANSDSSLEEERVTRLRSRKPRRKFFTAKEEDIQMKEVTFMKGISAAAKRRKMLKENLMRQAEKGKSFDYLGTFPGLVRKDPDESEKLNTLVDSFKDLFVDMTDTKVEFLPYKKLPVFDPQLHDIWGNLRQGKVEDQRNIPGHSRAFNDPTNEGVNQVANNTKAIESMALEENASEDVSEEGPPSGIHCINKLDDLLGYFEKHKTFPSLTKYGWEGPNLNAPRRNAISCKAGENKPNKKTANALDFTAIDWLAPENMFRIRDDKKGFYNAKAFHYWKKLNTNNPLLGTDIRDAGDIEDYEYEFSCPVPYKSYPAADKVPFAFRYFVNQNFSIINVWGNLCELKNQEGEDWNVENSFEFDEVEIARNEEYCSMHRDQEEEEHVDEEDCIDEENCPGLEGFDFESLGPLSASVELKVRWDANHDQSVRNALKAKDVNIRELKKLMRTVLEEHLYLRDMKPIFERETMTSFADVCMEILLRTEKNARHLLSIGMLTVAALHLASEHSIYIINKRDTTLWFKCLGRGKGKDKGKDEASTSGPVPGTSKDQE